MPYKSKQPGGATKAGPTQTEKDKSEVKELNSDERERLNDIEDTYADENGEPDPSVVHVLHQNRNTDKPDINKPAYGGT
ncbi:hypothetical protein HNQ92_001665 [Rhabdobacter roseus]|uniref:Uncharacterized protein n=1 Tax=Rhabdobacter roseus TaxID=1655419 RepID=A0A840TV41_9BACT|nr:hypothetical protein [Rhabdobacter roseus]MBB5283539.1 hypothetical protein [Rhabdobacter roseus]